MAKSAATIAKEQQAFALEQQELERARFENSLTIANDIEDVEHDEYAELFAGLGDSAEEKVLLYRLAPGSQKQGLLCRLDPGTSVEDIKPRFGGGDYVIKRLRSGMIMKSARLFIEGDPVFEQPKPANDEKPTADMSIQAIVASMQESNRALLEGMARIMQPAQNSEIQMLEKMAMYKNLFAQPQQAQNNGMEYFMKGMEFAKDVIPKNGGAETTGMDVMLEAVKGFAPAIGDITQRLNAQTPAMPSPQIQQIQQIPSTQQYDASPAQPTQDDEAMLKLYLAMMVSNAKAGKDPLLYADLIADNLSDEQLSQLLGESDLMAKLGSMNAGVLENRAWFEQVISELRNIVSLTEPETAPIVATNISTVAGENANIGSAENANNGNANGNS